MRCLSFFGSLLKFKITYSVFLFRLFKDSLLAKFAIEMDLFIPASFLISCELRLFSFMETKACLFLGSLVSVLCCFDLDVVGVNAFASILDYN